jgi:hypothetical protein
MLSVIIPFLAVTILPGYHETSSLNDQCYWLSDWGWSFTCGENVFLGAVIEHLLNWMFLLAVLSMLPFFIFFLPPTLSVFLLFFYFFALSYLFTKIRNRLWGRPLRSANETYYKVIKLSFITLLLISLPFQAYFSYKQHLVNSVYWKAKFDITHNDFNEKGALVEGYSRAIWRGISRNEPIVVQRLFRPDYEKNAEILTGSLRHDDYTITYLLLENGVTPEQKAIETIFDKIIRNESCDLVDNKDYKILDNLLKHTAISDNEIVKRAAISLCSPLMERLLQAGGDPNYTAPENKTLLYWASNAEIRSNNTLNYWLYGEPKEEIKARRRQMTDLITKYQNEAIFDK